MAHLLTDIRYALRQWRRAPVFLGIAVLTIGVGSGGVTAVLSVTNSLLFRSDPGIRDPHGLVEIRVGDRSGGAPRLMSFQAFEALRDADLGLDRLAAGNQVQASVSLAGEGPPEIVAGATVTRDYFSVLGTRPAAGRFFSPEEGLAGGGRQVAVLSYRYWTRRFGRDPRVIGSTVTVNRRPFVVIGVAEKGFHGHLPLYDYSLFLPLAERETLVGERPASSRVATVGRLALGSSVDRVAASTSRVEEEFRDLNPGEWGSASFVVEAHTRSYQEVRGRISLVMGFLMALAACILLIASANIANLLLSRGLSRCHETGVRRALGAGRGRLISQFLVENLLLFLAGGAVGVLMAYGVTTWLGAIEITLDAPLMGEYGPDARVLMVSLLATLAIGTVFGLAPAFRVSRPAPASVLRNPEGGSPGRNRLRNAFVVVQVAGSIVLLVGGGMLLRGLSRAGSMELGFEPEGVHVATVNLAIQKYTDEEGRRFLRRLLEEARKLPGAESAALTDFVFLASPPERGGPFRAPAGDRGVYGGLFGVSPDFFLTTGNTIVQGRSFDERDAAGADPVVIVNEKVAETLWPGERAVGKTLEFQGTTLRVVGVASNARYISIGESPLAAGFRPQTQLYAPTTSLLVKVGPGDRQTARRIQDLVRSLDPDIPLSANDAHLRLLGRQLLPQRLTATFASALGIIGLFLASVGLFGVLSAAVVQRSRELAVRIALGASPAAIRKSVLSRGLGLVLMGLLVGFPLALAASVLIRGLLLGVDPFDPVTLGTSSLLLVGVGLVASYIPALRATRTDPARILQRT